MALDIDRVEPGGTGKEIGFVVGDRVLSVNGHVVRDPLEWKYCIADEYVEIEVETDGRIVIHELEKDYEDTLDIHFTGPGFRKCNNRCIFCFIDQNPRKVRKPLRFKDEDFRLSFLYGNYVTLTNTPQEDLDRIVEQRLSPIYVSVHATEPALRKDILRNPRAPDILPIMHFLGEGGIELHAQIVFIPGINDGVHLDRTVDDLAAIPTLRSISIVPVGLTKHREHLPELNPVTPADAERLLRWQRRRHRAFLEQHGKRVVYISDEFYLLAGRRIPGAAFYETFPQVGNGVGMVRQFRDDFSRGLPRIERAFRDESLAVDLVTAVLPSSFLTGMIGRMNRRVPLLSVVTHVVENRRYGSGITVSGLLCGRDILDTLAEHGVHGQIVLLPPNCINDDGVFLDDMSIDQFHEELGRPVLVGSYDLIETILEARNRVREGTDSGLVSHELPLYGREADWRT
jgi:putative radical SAM enzyme (TIGR03279 family)